MRKLQHRYSQLLQMYQLLHLHLMLLRILPQHRLMCHLWLNDEVLPGMSGQQHLFGL